MPTKGSTIASSARSPSAPRSATACSTLGDDGLLAGRMADQRRAGLRAGRRPLHRLSRHRPARAGRAPSRCRRAPPGCPTSHDSLREMVHEIKTPLNAIIGFAEIIDGQYLGPAAPPLSRARGGNRRQARSLLEAAEDLDFAAKLQSAARQRRARAPTSQTFFPRFAEELHGARRAAGRDASMLDSTGLGGSCALEPELTERLLRRFTDAVLGAAAPGEHLAFASRQCAGHRCALQHDPSRVDRARAARRTCSTRNSPSAAPTGRCSGSASRCGWSTGWSGSPAATLEIDDDRFTLLPVPLNAWPSGCCADRRWWARRDSNPQPSRYERPALPVELQAPTTFGRWHARRMSFELSPGQLESVRWSGRQDSNLRPSAPKADALPGCATPRRGDALAARTAPPANLIARCPARVGVDVDVDIDVLRRASDAALPRRRWRSPRRLPRRRWRRRPRHSSATSWLYSTVIESLASSSVTWQAAKQQGRGKGDQCAHVLVLSRGFEGINAGVRRFGS